MSDYAAVLEKQKEFFFRGETKNIDFRMENLKVLKKALMAHETEMFQALKLDLNKSNFEAFLTEIGVLYNEINEAVKQLKTWAKPKKVKTGVTHTGSEGFIYPQPYGVSLIISPWNYPINLAIAPLIGAISAGCCAIVKPSELSPNTSAVLAKILNNTFAGNYIHVIEGGLETSQRLLELPFDHIFFTGSPAVGKVVMEAASKHLIPITLELGGKSPTIIHEDSKLKVAAKRIAWGKYTNAGQTCVAPDYLLVHKKVKAAFLKELSKQIKKLYGKNTLDNPNFPVIINSKHFDRLSAYLKQGEIYYGGTTDAVKRLIEPTILVEVKEDAPIMKEEIFGPILPVFEYGELDEVIQFVRKNPNPLALYLFTENKKVENHIIHNLSFGGGCINDVLFHVGTSHLPFGGVGASGVGSYHGKYSFEAFSHQKGVLHQTTKVDIPFRYPNSKGALALLKRLLK